MSNYKREASIYQKELKCLKLIRVKTELSDQENPTYYFKANTDEYESVEDNDYDAILTINFADDKSNKIADIIVNGEYFQIDQKDDLFEVSRIELYNEPWWKTRLRITNTLENIKSLIRYK